MREFRCWRGLDGVANAEQQQINLESFATGECDADVQSRVGSESGAALMLRYFSFSFPLRPMPQPCRRAGVPNPQNQDL